MSDLGKGYFCIHSESSGELKAFSASSRGPRHILKVEVEFTSAAEMGFAVDELAKLEASIKATRARVAKLKVSKAIRLLRRRSHDQ